MGKNEKLVLERKESEEMLNIIHANNKIVRKKISKKNKMINRMQNIFLGIVTGVLVVLFVYLTIDRKNAIEKCSKNHSHNYCERITGV